MLNSLLISDLVSKSPKKHMKKVMSKIVSKKCPFWLLLIRCFSFLCEAFSWWTFLRFLEWLRMYSELNSAFLYQFWYFSRILFWGLVSVFGNFGAQLSSHGTKYPKILLYELVLVSDFEPMKKFWSSIFSKIDQNAAL